jgi:hypothetical protein
LKTGPRGAAGQRFRWRGCGRTVTARTGTPCAQDRWPLEVITTAVRWSGRFRLSAAAVRDRLAERGVDGAAEHDRREDDGGVHGDAGEGAEH